MRKAIGFKIDEEKNIEDVVVERAIYNGFGRAFISLPPKIEKRRFCANFKSYEIGKRFIEMGNMLMRESKDITNLELKSRFDENLFDMGKTFVVELSYDIVDYLK